MKGKQGGKQGNKWSIIAFVYENFVCNHSRSFPNITHGDKFLTIITL